jgi:hypothetical protein
MEAMTEAEEVATDWAGALEPSTPVREVAAIRRRMVRNGRIRVRQVFLLSRGGKRSSRASVL